MFVLMQTVSHINFISIQQILKKLLIKKVGKLF